MPSHTRGWVRSLVAEFGALALVVIVEVAAADVRLPAVIGSGMVLQREMEAPLWGWADAGERVRLKADWLADEVTVTAGQDGTWRVRVRTPGAGGPYKIAIAGHNTVTLENVLIGEVWVCSGQSNMQWSIGPVFGPGVDNYADVIKAADYPNIRLFNVKNTVAAAPAADCAGSWTPCTPQTVAPFSAVGYFFGRALHQELKVPIGLIGGSWGGTPAEAWTSKRALREVPELAARFAEPLAAVARLRDQPEPAAIGPHTATTLYNGMIAPLVPFGIRGVIWYQGEANRLEARLYRTLFPGLIADWRRSWGQGDFPFYYVQIAPYEYDGDKGQTAELREAQLRTLATPNTGMVVTMDIGNPRDIHPQHKDEVGQRLALWALAKTYGRSGLVYSGPLYKSMKVEGARIRLSFEHIGGGLVSRGGGPLAHFVIAGEGRWFHPAKAVIDGDTVVVSSGAVPEPVAVRYAWGTADEPTLANAEGLPASPFRTDDWEGVEVRSRLRAWVPSAGDAAAPASLVLAAPIDRWDEGVPLGNGLTGGLLWGGGNRINLSLDRGDLWDLRTPEVFQRDDWNYATMQRLVAAGDQAKLSELFDAAYESIPYPTKIPVGRLVVTLAPDRRAHTFALDLSRAEARVDLDRDRIECFYSAAAPVAMLRLPGRPTAIELVRPDALDKLGYAPAVTGSAGETRWLVQEAAKGLCYAVVVGSQPRTDTTELAVAITSTHDGPDPLRIGRERVERALDAGYEEMLRPHLAWWQNFWSISRVRVPGEEIQGHYDLVKYFYGAASRAAAPPMALQGVWTADDGNLPPWKGDFHNDLNTQMTYLAYHAAGLVDAGESFLNFNWKLRPAYQEFARRFYGVPGLVVPGVTALDGQPLAGWGMYSLSPTMGAWVAHSFYLHWRYTMDGEFLRERAYPWCAEVGQALRALLKPDENGRLKLALSSSPEIFDNTLRAWLPPNSNFDLSLLRWLLGALAEMAAAGGQKDAAHEWTILESQLDDLDVEGEAGSLTFARGIPYDQSHRHFSHVMALHPLGTLHVEGSERDRAVIRASLDRILEKGTDGWCGYSFSWLACMLARCGRAEEALDYLEKYERAFTLRNGFHANGDQTGTGLSRFTYRPFTLEGNFLAMQAVHEMLLQSWGGVIRVFPAVSAHWPDAAFTDLRAEGAFRVSAARRKGRTELVSITAACDGVLRLRDPFAGGVATWNRDDVKTAGVDYEVHMKKGDVLTGRLTTADDLRDLKRSAPQ